ncbi:unnamed protein product, partial [Polarella glacialis]
MFFAVVSEIRSCREADVLSLRHKVAFEGSLGFRAAALALALGSGECRRATEALCHLAPAAVLVTCLACGDGYAALGMIFGLLPELPQVLLGTLVGLQLTRCPCWLDVLWDLAMFAALAVRISSLTTYLKDVDWRVGQAHLSA